LVLASLKKNDEAAAAYQRAIALKPEAGNFTATLGWLCTHRGKTSRPLSPISRTGVKTQLPQVANNLGAVLLALGRLENGLPHSIARQAGPEGSVFRSETSLEYFCALGVYEEAGTIAKKQLRSARRKPMTTNNGPICQGANQFDRQSPIIRWLLRPIPKTPTPQQPWLYL